MLIPILLLSTLSPNPSHKGNAAIKKIPAPTITALSEYNLGFGYISPGYGSQPSIQMHITVTIHDGFILKSGETIEFENNDPQNVTLVTTSATTDNLGQCKAIIISSGVPTYGSSVITAKWTRSNGQVLTSDVTIYNIPDNSNETNTPTGFSLGPINPSKPVQYVDQASSWIAPYVVASRSAWTIPNKITWAALGTPGNPTASGPHAVFWDTTYDYLTVDPSDLAYVKTLDLNNGVTIRYTRFNVWSMNGNPLPTNQGGNSSKCARVSWRHHVQSTVNHETGHLLGFTHNESLVSLMYQSVDNYFLWGIESPQSCDLAYVSSSFPLPAN